MQPDRALWHMATAAIMLAAAFPSARAAELGSLVIHSVIGQPLNGEIAIDDARPGEKLAVQPALRDTYRRAGVDYDSLLVGLRASVERHDGRVFIRLRTEQPVRKPALPILIELRSRSGFERARYNAHIEPTAQAPVQAESGPARPTVLPSSEAAEGKAPKIESARQPGTGAVLPLSREELFGVTKQEAPVSREELFGIPGEKPTKAAGPKPLEWHGYISNYTAYDYSDPEHWSRGVFRAQVGTEGGGGGLGGGLKWKFTARVDVDPVYSWTDFYPEEVRKDQRFDAWLRETYIDTGSGDFSLRLGKQNIVWGEMVGLFFADVVSARDLRDFILPDFETIRIPQWAARGEYYGENSHLELIWLPYPAVDDIGKPGAEFYPFQAPPPTGFNQRFNNEVRPARTLSNTNWGVRASTLQGGWDLSAFYYRSTDVNATFYRDVILTPTPTLVYTPRHDRIWQAGGTLAKAFASVVAKAEVVYAAGRQYNVTRLSEPDGVVPQDTLDYVLGLDFTLPRETRMNIQYFRRIFFDHDPDLLFERFEDGVSLLLSGAAGARIQPELFVVQSLNRSDRMVRVSVGMTPATNWRVTTGVVTFAGPVTGFFGRFARDDRVYVELRRDF